MEADKDDGKLSSAIEFVARVSARAQQLAHDDQDVEFNGLMQKHASDLACLGCGKKLEYEVWGDAFPQVWYHNGALFMDTVGYGSSKHDMAKVGFVVCDDCLETKAVSSQWLDKLHKHFDVEVLKPEYLEGEQEKAEAADGE